jgi:transcriptional regulator with XRE-family HTH domain
MDDGAVGGLLRTWRARRGKSQLALSLDAGVSQKHVSFVESGRSHASRQMLLDLAQALDMPLRERNVLLAAGGFAPVFTETPLDGTMMAMVTRALRRMLAQQEPFPALVLDRHWNVVMTNEAAPRFFSLFADLASRPLPRNLLHVVFDPTGLRPALENWDELAPALLARVRREAPGGVIDPGTQALLDALARYPKSAAATRPPPPAAVELPMVPMAFRLGGQVLRYFSLVTTVGTPRAVSAQELRIECLFPADDATEVAHARLMIADHGDAEAVRSATPGAL